MKKIISLSIIFLVPLCLTAQGPISFGPKVGWNSNKLTTDYTTYIEDMREGAHGGLFFSIYMNRVYIQPEAYFSLRRGKLDATVSDPLNSAEIVDLNQEVTLTTVDIPLLLGVKLIDLKLIRFRLWGGPVASYVLNKKYVLRINGKNESYRISRDDFRDATWSGQVGAGMDLLFLTLDIGYEFGFEDFLTIQSMDDLGFRNNMWFISLGWRLF
jgi:hypothetical protein